MLPSSETSVNRNPPERLGRPDPIQVLGPCRLVRGQRASRPVWGEIGYSRARAYARRVTRPRPKRVRSRAADAERKPQAPGGVGAASMLDLSNTDAYNGPGSRPSFPRENQ